MTHLFEGLKVSHWVVAFALAATPVVATAASPSSIQSQDDDYCCDIWGCEGGPDQCITANGVTCYKNALEPCA